MCASKFFHNEAKKDVYTYWLDGRVRHLLLRGFLEVVEGAGVEGDRASGSVQMSREILAFFKNLLLAIGF